MRYTANYKSNELWINKLKHDLKVSQEKDKPRILKQLKQLQMDNYRYINKVYYESLGVEDVKKMYKKLRQR